MRCASSSSTRARWLTTGIAIRGSRIADKHRLGYAAAHTLTPHSSTGFGDHMFDVCSRSFRSGARVALFSAGAIALLVSAAPLAAQTAPTLYFACYVPLTGTVYRIKEANL